MKAQNSEIFERMTHCAGAYTSLQILGSFTQNVELILNLFVIPPRKRCYVTPDFTGVRIGLCYVKSILRNESALVSSWNC
jgi:hypothetical protein